MSRLRANQITNENAYSWWLMRDLNSGAPNFPHGHNCHWYCH